MAYTSHNTIVFQGNLGADPERRESKSEIAYYILNVAQSIYKGEGQPTGTNWFRCLIWESSRLAKLIPHLRKGSKVLITGSLDEVSAFIGKKGEALAQLNVSVLNMSFAETVKKEEKQEESPATEEEYPPF